MSTQFPSSPENLSKTQKETENARNQDAKAARGMRGEAQGPDEDFTLSLRDRRVGSVERGREGKVKQFNGVRARVEASNSITLR
jgi:hypothetical protein